MNLPKFLAVSLVASFACANLSHAGKVDVVNQNQKALKVKIQAEGDAKDGTLASHVQDITAAATSTFDVEPTHLGGKTMYSITGDTNAFTSGDTCAHLDTNKNYTVTFLDDKMGTTCKAEETVAVAK